MTAGHANDNNRLLTPEQAAARLTITEDHLRALVANGAIGYINVGLGKKRPRRRFTEADIDDFIERRRGREVPCPSIKTHDRHITRLTSGTAAIGFMAQRNARRGQTPSDTRH